MENGIIILAIVATLMVFVTGFSYVGFQKNREKLYQSELENSRIREQLVSVQTQEESLNKRFELSNDEVIMLRAQLNKQLETLVEQKVQLEQQQIHEAKTRENFSRLAQDVFEKNSQKLQENSEKSLGNLLNPMKVQLADFKKKVEDVYDKEAKDRTALQYELKGLKELNLKMSSDANNLTNALKGQNKQQGVWGEMVLETVLESSGLREGHEYEREVNLKDEYAKNFRPDVIVNLPHDRHIIIDAKTSLSAYNEYMAEEDEEIKKGHIRSHIISIKTHIKGLTGKNYEDLTEINSLDFIFMFVPIEGALMLALENDPSLYDDSFKQKIILVSPTTLLVALRAVENSWRYEKQAQSIADVAKRAESLYGKFTGFVENLSAVGTHLEKADKSYQDAFKQLSSGAGNLIMQVNDLKKVSSIKPKKELPQKLVDEALLES